MNTRVSLGLWVMDDGLALPCFNMSGLAGPRELGRAAVKHSKRSSMILMIPMRRSEEVVLSKTSSIISCNSGRPNKMMGLISRRRPKLMTTGASVSVVVFRGGRNTYILQPVQQARRRGRYLQGAWSQPVGHLLRQNRTWRCRRQTN